MSSFVMPATSTMIDLRKILTENFPHPPPRMDGQLCTGVPAVDEVTGGGLPKSAITELIAPQMSAGSATLIHALLQCDSAGETPAGPTGRVPVLRPIALVDGRDSFDPASSQNSSLRHLLWIRCGNAIEAIKATDLLLRDGNFPLVIVDLVLNSREELRKIPQTSWYRLQRLVEVAATACLVLSRHSVVSSAQLKLLLENVWTLKSLEAEDAISRLRFRIQRSHLKSVVSGQWSVVN